MKNRFSNRAPNTAYSTQAPDGTTRWAMEPFLDCEEEGKGPKFPGRVLFSWNRSKADPEAAHVPIPSCRSPDANGHCVLLPNLRLIAFDDWVEGPEAGPVGHWRWLQGEGG